MTLLLPSRLPIVAIVLTTALAVLTGCNNMSPNITNVNNPTSSSTIMASTAVPSTVMQPAIHSQIVLSPALQSVVGDYASADYDKRRQGYDWVGIEIRAFDAAKINIKVRSRSDIKKPSCSYEGQATLMGQDEAHGIVFKTVANDSVTFLQFKNGKLTIDAQDKYALNTFCSGGATLAGDYQKLAGHLEVS